MIDTKDVDRTRWRWRNYAGKVSGITGCKGIGLEDNAEWLKWHENVRRYHAGKHNLKIPFTSPCQNEHRSTLTSISFIDNTFKLLLVVGAKLYLSDIRLLHKHAVFSLMIIHHKTTTRTISSIIHKFNSQKHCLENLLYNTQCAL